MASCGTTESRPNGPAPHRDVIGTPAGGVWFVTNNTDGRGDAGPDDDRILSVRASR